MDPTTTLITFMLQTSPSVHSVQLIGSWDNFTKHYTMEKDSRRAQGQWRGCYAFDNIIYDGDGQSSPVRKGGLKMGHTYWYYYKLDGEIETHDSTLPSTTACPILPGQPMNMISIPTEEAPVRNRSASVGSAAEPLKTMNPADKYETPRPPPPTQGLMRLNTSTGFETSMRKRPTRSESPKRSPWSPRALFGPKIPASPLSNHSHDRGMSIKDGDAKISYPVLISRTDTGRKCVPLEEIQRQNSIQSLPKPKHTDFEAVDKSPISEWPTIPPKLNLAALEAIDDEDDANFACSPLQRHGRDSQHHPTVLTPPPVRGESIKSLSSPRGHEPTLRLLNANLSEFDEKAKPLPSVPNYGRDQGTSRPNPHHAPLCLATPENDSRILRTDLHAPATTPDWTPRSHFSLDSLDERIEEPAKSIPNEATTYTVIETTESDFACTGMISPTNSQYSSGCASPTSILEYEEDNYLAHALNFSGLGIGIAIGCEADMENLVLENDQTKAVSPTRSEFQYNATISEVSSRGFQGYSLPDPAEYGSEHTLMQELSRVECEEDTARVRTGRATFGGPLAVDVDGKESLGGTFQGLLDDLGYLGEAINHAS